METGLSIRNDQNEITQILQDSNNMYLSFYNLLVYQQKMFYLH